MPVTKYMVQRGDNLTKIAANYGTSARAIAEANGIKNPNLIYPDQELVIPDGSSTSDSASGSSAGNISTNAPTAETYTYNPYNTTADGEKMYGAMNDAYEKLQGYGDFSYDFNVDALYQQYKDKYIQQGKMAMADAIGQASAMTGGYGNSYAATVGNQQYQAQLNNLNDIIPDLYQMAYDRWNDKYDRTKDAYSAASSAYYNAADLYGTERNTINTLKQQNFENEFGVWDANNENAWKQAEWDENMRRYEKEMAMNSIVSGGSSGGSGGGRVTVDKGGNLVVEPTSDTSAIRKKLDGMSSNTEVESYLERQEAAGVISHEEALKLMAEYMDDNEVYADTDDGGKVISYKGMVGSSKGWSVVDNGGTNWFWGVDNNARVKAPNGETHRLDDLVNKLVSEGMSKSEAKAAVKKLQKKLGI